MLKSFFQFIRFQPWLQIGLILTVIGFLMFWLGAAPGDFGQDRSPILGYNQVAVLSVGLGIFCLGGCLCLLWLWRGKQRSIAADFGWRLVCTGYIIAVWSAMADIWGFGTQPLPKTQCFGPWQERGVLAGQVIIALGYLLMIPWRKQTIKKDNPIIINEEKLL